MRMCSPISAYPCINLGQLCQLMVLKGQKVRNSSINLRYFSICPKLVKVRIARNRAPIYLLSLTLHALVGLADRNVTSYSYQAYFYLLLYCIRFACFSCSIFLQMLSSLCRKRIDASRYFLYKEQHVSLEYYFLFTIINYDYKSRIVLC